MGYGAGDQVFVTSLGGLRLVGGPTDRHERRCRPPLGRAQSVSEPCEGLLGLRSGNLLVDWNRAAMLVSW